MFFIDSLEEANRYRDKAQFQSEVDSSASESPHFSKTKPRRKKIQVKKPASFSADQESDSLSSNEEENVPTTNFLNLGGEHYAIILSILSAFFQVLVCM